MKKEDMFQLAVQLTAAKLQAHFISPAVVGVDDWIHDQIAANWTLLERAWLSCTEGSDLPKN